MHILKCLLWLTCCWVCYSTAQPTAKVSHQHKAAAQSKLLSLHEAILLALRNNPDVESYALQRVVDQFALEVAHNAFSPQYSFTGSAAYQDGSQAQYSVAPGISIASPIGTSAAVTYNNAIGGELGTTNLGTTNISITQPLLQGYGSHINKIPVFNADDSERIAKINYSNNVAIVVVNVINQYNILVADHNSLLVQNESLKQAKEILRQFKLKLKLGKIAPSDIVQQEATYAATQLTYAQQQIKQTQDYQLFLQLLGLDPISKLGIQTHLDIKKQLPIPSEKKCIELALQNNPQYRIAILNLKILKRAVDFAKNQQLWQVDLTYNKAIGNIGSNSTIDPHPIYGVNVSIPIHNLPLKQQLVNAKIAYAQAKLELQKLKRSLVSGVITQVQNIHSLYDQIAISENAVSYQVKALKATEIKQTYGKASSFDLSQQQTLVLQQRITLINNKIALVNAISNLNLTLGITLEQWNIRLRG